MRSNRQVRAREIDVLKAIAILLMVATHAGMPFHRFVYLFHMPVFFMASGLFFRIEAVDSFASLRLALKKRIRGLWIPYALANVFFSVWEMLLYHCDTKTTLMKCIKSAFMVGGTDTGGALWFVACLFFATVLYLFVGYLINVTFPKRTLVVVQSCAAVIAMLAGWLFPFAQVARIFVAFGLYHLGALLADVKGNSFVGKNFVADMMMFIASVALLLLLNDYGAVSLSGNVYPNPLFLVTASLAGWYLLMEVSFAIRKMGLVTRIFEYIGRHTLSIVIWHLFFFMLLGMLPGIPSWKEHAGCWWIFFAVVGTVASLLMSFTWLRIRRLLCSPAFEVKQKEPNDCRGGK